MMDRANRKLIITLALAIVGFGAVFALSGRLETIRPPQPEGFEDQDLALKGAGLRGYALGFEGLLADWYWMESLQYIGGKILRNPQIKVSIDDLNPLNPRLLYPYLDNATTLDPRFKAPFYYGAVVLPAIDKQQAVRIAEKGIASNPDEWRLYQYLGFIYWRLEEYDKAADVYERGAKIDGAPKFMQMMVAQMRSQGGSRDTARAIYQQMFDGAEDGQTKDLAALRLLELDSFDDRDQIRAALGQFKDQNNRCANNWTEIFPILKNLKLPRGRQFLIDKNNELLDPTGVPYILKRETCDVSINYEKSKLPS